MLGGVGGLGRGGMNGIYTHSSRQQRPAKQGLQMSDVFIAICRSVSTATAHKGCCSQERQTLLGQISTFQAMEMQKDCSKQGSYYAADTYIQSHECGCIMLSSNDKLELIQGLRFRPCNPNQQPRQVLTSWSCRPGPGSCNSISLMVTHEEGSNALIH